MSVDVPTWKSVNQIANEQYTTVETATIVKNGTRSNAVNLAGRSPVRLLVPAGWKSTSPVVRVQVSEDNVAWYPLYTAAGTGYTIPAVKSRATQLSPDAFRGVAYIRLHSTMARGTTVTQGTISPIGVVSRLI